MPGAVLSTRLFPRQQGCDAYELTGIAARCDWVVLSDYQRPTTQIRRLSDTPHPRTIFLSLRAPHLALVHFASEVLPGLQRPVVLISGSEDITLPRQTDLRWRPFGPAEQAAIAQIAASPMVRRWFVENLDDVSDPKMQPMPVGLVAPDPAPLHLPDVPRQSERPLRVLCAHRVREGGQWDLRRRVSGLARDHWSDWTTVLEEDAPPDVFEQHLQAHAFVLCVEGGGVDPSPKAWQALIHGAIPIIRSRSLRAAYACLPVVCLEDWTVDQITLARLAAWQAVHMPMFDTPEGRATLCHRLSLDYWWAKVTAVQDPA